MTELDYLMLAREYIAGGEEGYVIKFKDGQMVKLKHLSYIAAHGLMDDLSQEHKVIEMILNETIDDVLAELEEGCEEREYIEEVIHLIDGYYNHRVECAMKLRDIYYNDYKEDRKAFAIANSKVQDFGLVMKNLTGENIPTAVKASMLRELSHLEKARDFLDTLRENQ